MPDPDVVARLRAAGCVFAEDEAALLLADGRDVDGLVAERARGTPLEHVLGWAAFDGLRVAVDPGVFVPRRRSEVLVRRAAELAGPGPRTVVDLGAGTGALGLAVARRLAGPVTLHGVDLDPAAVACARRNGVTAFLGDLFDPLPPALRGRVDLVVLSAPYVPTDRIALMPPEARDHEARTALDGGPDGLDVVRRAAAAAPAWLAEGGLLVTEVGEHQGPAATDALRAAGLVARCEYDEDATVVVAQHRAGRSG